MDHRVRYDDLSGKYHLLSARYADAVELKVLGPDDVMSLTPLSFTNRGKENDTGIVQHPLEGVQH